MFFTGHILIFTGRESFFPVINDFYLPGIIFTCWKWLLLAGNGIYRANNGFYRPRNGFYRPDNDFYLSGNGIYRPDNDFYQFGYDLYRTCNDFYGAGNDFYRPEMVFTGMAMIFTAHKRCLPGPGLYLPARNDILLVNEHFSLAVTLFLLPGDIFPCPLMIYLCYKALRLLNCHD